MLTRLPSASGVLKYGIFLCSFIPRGEYKVSSRGWQTNNTVLYSPLPHVPSTCPEKFVLFRVCWGGGYRVYLKLDCRQIISLKIIQPFLYLLRKSMNGLSLWWIAGLNTTLVCACGSPSPPSRVRGWHTRKLSKPPLCVIISHWSVEGGTMFYTSPLPTKKVTRRRESTNRRLKLLILSVPIIVHMKKYTKK